MKKLSEHTAEAEAAAVYHMKQLEELSGKFPISGLVKVCGFDNAKYLTMQAFTHRNILVIKALRLSDGDIHF